MSATIPSSVPDEPDARSSGGAGIPPVPVPDELGSVPAGALLAALLEDIEIEQVSGHDTVEVMLAEYRLWCRQTARFYRAVLETGLRRPFSIDTVERVSTLGEFAAEEARAALVWSRSRAEATIGFAFDIFDRLPLLGEAMLAGQLAEPRARALITWTDGLDTERADAVCQQLLPTAGTVTVGELIEQIKRTCLAIDPDWAEKKYRAAVQTRRVRGFLGPDGTGTLTGQSQPAERVIAACERIDALARACKRAGDTRAIDHIRSDLFLGMTDGTLEGLTEPEIIAHVLAHPYTLPGDHHDPNTDDPSSGPGPGDNPDGSGNAGGHGGAGRGGAGSGGAAATRSPAPAAAPEPPPTASPAPSAEPAAAREPAEPTGGLIAAARPRGGEPARAWPVPEVRVQLGTLLGLNDEPGEVPGWGYVPGWLARHLVARMHSAQWRYAICDEHGHAIDGGLITSRPSTPGRPRTRRDARRGGIVEIAAGQHEPARLLDRPTGPATGQATGHTIDQAAGPATHQAADPTAGPAGGAIVAWAAVLTELAQAAAEPGAARPPDPVDPARRTPGAVLRRWIQQRDRRCVHPCCRVPATKADQDHRIGYAHGGPTIEANLSTPCRHDHRLKDQGHWRISTPQPALSVWTSPLGHQYQSRPPPAISPLAIPPPVRADIHCESGWEPPGAGPISRPEPCACVITPCPHDQPDTATSTADAERIADAEPTEPDTAAPEPNILDNGKPPF